MSLPAPYLRGLRGDLRPLPAWIREMDPSDPGWSAAARALWWMAQPDRCPRPTAPNTPSPGAVEAHSLLGRAGLVALDFPAVDDAIGALRLIETPRAQSWADMLQGMRGALAGEERALQLGEQLAKRAADAQWSSLLVDATLVRALSHMTRGELAEATSLARRAARMAQTEHLWISNYFASLVLARLRRLGGRPHLAGLIASACVDLAPPAFAGWLRWELLFAGILRPSENESFPADRASALAHRFFRAGLAEDELAELRATIAPSVAHRRDFESAFVTMQGLVPEPGELHAWVCGEVAAPPAELLGLTPPAWKREPDAAPLVIAAPGRAPVRALGFAVPPSYPRLQVGTRAARPEALAAALTLASEGVSREDLFERVYGFPYRKSVHEASFKVVRHQVKKLLEGYATIVHQDGQMRVDVGAPYAILDPRCQQPFHDIVLRYLAGAGSASAKELASRLDVPLRTVQMALREMTEEGICIAAKDGRRVSYTVEDTTFCELTVV